MESDCFLNQIYSAFLAGVWISLNSDLDVADNMRELLSEVTKKELMPTSKRMGYLNNFAQVNKVLVLIDTKP